MEAYAFGVDIGGTAIKVGLFHQHILMEKMEIPTRREEKGSHVLPDVAALIEVKMKEHQITWEELEGIGMGVPGPVDETGTVLQCVNLGWDEVNLPLEMKRLLPELHKFSVGNDVNVATLGEMWKGSASGYNSAVMITLGTGVGGGVVIKDEMFYGAYGSAGELGHMCVNPWEQESCRCGSKGCLEQYASASGLLHQTQKKLAQTEEPSVLREISHLTAKAICDAAREGDTFARERLEELGKIMGYTLGNITCVLDPQIYLIGGGLSKAGEILLDPIQRYYKKYAFHTSKNTKIALASLGNDAGIYGCMHMLIKSY